MHLPSAHLSFNLTVYTSCRVMSCHVMSRPSPHCIHIMSCHVMSCHVMSRPSPHCMRNPTQVHCLRIGENAKPRTAVLIITTRSFSPLLYRNHYPNACPYPNPGPILTLSGTLTLIISCALPRPCPICNACASQLTKQTTWIFPGPGTKYGGAQAYPYPYLRPPPNHTL